ncbi:ras-related protein Rab-37 isoform X1 [Chelonus insularis]|uniref:ras-related protein Rab-37 isoform X1 n=1 Tax=Chelonus insularis TaxID=460826 RepID=UPI00158BECF1|nr:ras-related protein Rab-37 isoform X1 [Chelonus insularis]XP_034948485.1 ras-related protein Rab-37 isoform X1 [Chelonus insularis]XP_034948486.1 ras-related protein Rab-37 isoform X1 [Chelonus insularis]XP_034948488.1 ras-related protein Rab-37 isoform X1 [Chelonus insularis]XP_034948489.1 ras-related protein Rab-37 isoform X1 [Chelonus insularis]XP_034948490.1 ras-related protein Rab-37 isoform X1 [Chelonus insularis]
MRGGSSDNSGMITIVPTSASLNSMETGDETFEMDGEDQQSMLTPADQLPMTTPSPTGYRDYQPPAEVLGYNGYQSNISRNLNKFSPRRDFGKEEVEETHKTILLGDSGVGKTSLLVRFDTGSFQTGNFAATVGIGFTNKVVDVGDMRIKLQIWDTAGQERFRSVTHAYYRDAHALLLLYDVTNKTSFDNIRAWLSEIREYAQSDVVIMLLGNKTDCGNERVVKKEDGQRLADEYQVPFMETSAKTGVNVDLAFLAIARQLQARKSENPDETKFNVHEYVRQQSQSRSTCFSTNCQTT